MQERTDSAAQLPSNSLRLCFFHDLFVVRDIKISLGTLEFDFKLKLRGFSIIMLTYEPRRLTKSIEIVLCKFTYNDFFHSAFQTSGLTM